MPLPTIKMNFEGIIKYGAAGSSAGTVIENCRDITYALSSERGDTTVRGDSTSPPVETAAVSKRMASIEFTMLHDTSDGTFAALETAAAAGTPVAIRTLSHATGKGYDGDCTLERSAPFPLAGEQVVSFTCFPYRDENRSPSLNV